MGRGAIVIGLAAVIIGEAVFGRVFHNFGFRLLGVALGSIIYYLVLQVVIWLGVDTDLLKLLSAVVVAIFLAVPTWKNRYLLGTAVAMAFLPSGKGAVAAAKQVRRALKEQDEHRKGGSR